MYDEYDDDLNEFDTDEGIGDWAPGECDNCPGGEPTRVPFGFIYCACQIGQGADPENCACGPDQN
ncbi:hypothetical protein P3T27_002043 [Kitasatospora sp. MAA19]|uniref:hypothetical protein n=1 Tax=Kitasatospora sp. MAA19 TaxID=3035090 RepID=UPI002474BBDB|nr:hypothetical protein [Kitasatospora sp. MAA19]MDH6705333.1 hypothetical protein [Kitasatospora sp. MAA19]